MRILAQAVLVGVSMITSGWVMPPTLAARKAASAAAQRLTRS